MNSTRNHILMAVAAAAAIALGSALVLAAPAEAADTDLAPSQVITGINHPDGIAVASDGTVFVSDDDGSILAYQPQVGGDLALQYTITGLSEPEGLSVDASGHLWVAERSGAVVELDPGVGGPAVPITTLTGTLVSPTDVAIGPDGSIYVTDDSDAVDVFAPGATGGDKPIRTIAGDNTDFAALQPRGVAIQADGSIVVVDDIGEIQTFAPDDATDIGADDEAALRTISDSNGQLFNSDYVALDSFGNIFVTDADVTQTGVLEYPEMANGDVGPTVRIIGNSTGLDSPGPIAIDGQNHIYVGNDDASADSVTEYSSVSSSTPPILTAVTPASGSEIGGQLVTITGTGFASDASVTFGQGAPATDVVVVSSTEITAVSPPGTAHQVAVDVSQDGGTVDAILGNAYTYTLTPATGDADLSPVRVVRGDNTDIDDPDGLAVAPDGTTYVSGDNGSILGFARDADHNATPEYDITPSATNGLTHPQGLAEDASGDLWVADISGKVLEFAPKATGPALPINTITGTLVAPSDLAIGPNGDIYVVDNGDAVDVFAANATGSDAPINTISGAGTDFSTLDPWGIALEPDGSIVIADEADAIQTFSASSSGPVTAVRTIIGGNTRLEEPGMIATDATGDIFATNYGSSTVTEYAQSATGDVAPIARIVGTATEVSSPWPVAFDGDGNLYVGDCSCMSNSILVFGMTLSQTAGTTTGGQKVTIDGIGFPAGATVSFGGADATDVTVVSPTEITAVVPAHTAGRVDVVISAQDSTQVAALPDGYRYIATLATTGVDPTPATGAGILLLAIGGLLLVARRRMRRAARP